MSRIFTLNQLTKLFHLRTEQLVDFLKSYLHLL